MSRPQSRPSASSAQRLQQARRPSVSLPLSVPQLRRSSSATLKPKAAAVSRSSKTTQKLVFLPTDPQTQPIREVGAEDDDDVHGYETDAGVRVRERKSSAERMSKADRRRAGFRRITAYCVAESVRLKILASFLKREHNVAPRAYDNAIYAMYHLPLLPGYGPNTNIRSSAPPPAHDHAAASAALSEVEDAGYQGMYFSSSPPAGHAPFNPVDGYISTSPADDRRALLSPPLTTPSAANGRVRPDPASFAEAVFFAYGVIVFFGLDEVQERGILEDITAALALRRQRPDDRWEVEELNFAYDPTIASPRIYNDFFTLKQPSHLLTLSIAHAIAQSTLLAYYETLTTTILSDPATTAIPLSLARTGALQISRTNAMKLTGKLFRLRRDVVLIGNVLDVPDMFWEEASLQGLYDAVREYFEIGERVRGVEERVAGARGLLDAIHDHLNNHAMERITWVIIWLIVVACMVEVGEVVARLIVHATTANAPKAASVATGAGTALVSNATPAAAPLVVQRMGAVVDLSTMSREEALSAVERMFGA
ncbi:hypothetical protein K488DRAFT_48984 [Vararia minispora EC-137]|uniref:Uncharacterized protein n=1 Tax=Vararia minispora EC-137 TaxID=1314806 RepID=A0ACB8QMK6_9AGAM|nr:hypothetical protein K488DRAFT_48984 [Vararia minispora EC-137]